MIELKGNIHIHSQLSDGGGTIEEIIEHARKAGLDFIILTDHHTLEGKQSEEYQDGVLLLSGMEVNERCNHYLALDVDQVIADNEEDPQKVIDAVNGQNGIGVIAHPVEKGSAYLFDNQTYPWTDWTVHGFQGIEIWNFLSQWRDGISSLGRGLYLLFNPHTAMTGPYREIMSILDQFQQSNDCVFAYGGSDAHGFKVKAGPFTVTISPYPLCFRCINMHLLSEQAPSGRFENDRRLVYDALRRGRSWIAYDYFKSSRGFRFEVRGRSGTWTLGDRAAWEPGMVCQVNTPYFSRTSLIRNGQVEHRGEGKRFSWPIAAPGVYRIESCHRYHCRYRPWIFSNPVRITQE